MSEQIAEWGATFNPFRFVTQDQSQLTTTIPSNTPSGEYLVRIEQIGLHVAGAPQWYISCAQINVSVSLFGCLSRQLMYGFILNRFLEAEGEIRRRCLSLGMCHQVIPASL